MYASAQYAYVSAYTSIGGVRFSLYTEPKFSGNVNTSTTSAPNSPMTPARKALAAISLLCPITVLAGEASTPQPPVHKVKAFVQGGGIRMAAERNWASLDKDQLDVSVTVGIPDNSLGVQSPDDAGGVQLFVDAAGGYCDLELTSASSSEAVYTVKVQYRRGKIKAIAGKCFANASAEPVTAGIPDARPGSAILLRDHFGNNYLSGEFWASGSCTP